MRKSPVATVLAVLFVVPSFAHAAPQAPVSLPPVERTLAAADAVPRACAQGLQRDAAGVATSAYRAPMSGFVTVRLASAGASDWDLALFDAATGRRLAASQSFGSDEVTQTWVRSGQELVAQGCRRHGGARSAALSFELFDVAPPQSAGTPALLSVRYGGNRDLQRLEHLGVDLTHNIHNGLADVIVNGSGQAELLRKHGFAFTTKVADLPKADLEGRAADLRFGQRVSKSSLPSGRTGYRMYEDYQSELKALVENPAFQGHVRPAILPKRTVQGRELSGVEIASNVNAVDDGRPVYFVVALHHAREWPAAEVAMEYARMLAESYGTDQRVTDLLKRVRVVVVPLINADGFVASRTAVDPADQTGDENLLLAEQIAPPGPFAYRRKNCGGGLPAGAPCDVQYGIDPNRNYGEGWGGAGASMNPLGLTYRGPGPWSEPETQAVHEYSQRRQITNIITLHNVAALVLRPPGRRSDGLAPDEPRLKALGDQMADATGYTSQYGWELYDTSGTTE
ncbi:MAG: hypothetical protein QOJ97_2756, partial [Solirubrobacteraceae bacterium]|nr:hypothetical protein [Solirubrobacteraceae bacterium]